MPINALVHQLLFLMIKSQLVSKTEKLITQLVNQISDNNKSKARTVKNAKTQPKIMKLPGFEF